ncbi:heavy metal-responsive transcriptional regulator [Microbacterium sp. LRZ72]|uniref:heavy metal-responsive transcriptional regulator n=1 Tax=Microbacterium sp. LRZ72 TaxID=2942481 RepID=UPI0029A25379|nr:heavy metal-responsive transcriptional regulator [Microbacterium sp. LRZ72]MDX2377747.1 heavy metal-responsive transcriptional regulator [Microbacterium sp. LRZ72]
MLIGALATATGQTTQALRFYERHGLLPPPSRAANGYRTYEHGVIQRINFIRAAQSAGLTLEEIRSVLDLRDEGSAPCRHLGDLIESKLLDVRRRMHELAALEVELERLRARSRNLDPADCSPDAICRIITE